MFDHDYANYPELPNSLLEVMRFSSPHKQIEDDFTAVVNRVYDGDTIILQTTFRDFLFPLRFLEINAPEMNEGGKEARDWLKTKIEGKTVEIKIDKQQRVGKYGRLLGKVFFNGMDIGMEQLYLGLVKPFGLNKEGEILDLDKYCNIKKWLA